jgi:hypothetical protein
MVRQRRKGGLGPHCETRLALPEELIAHRHWMNQRPLSQRLLPAGTALGVPDDLSRVLPPDQASQPTACDNSNRFLCRGAMCVGSRVTASCNVVAHAATRRRQGETHDGLGPRLPPLFSHQGHGATCNIDRVCQRAVRCNARMLRKPVTVQDLPTLHDMMGASLPEWLYI